MALSFVVEALNMRNVFLFSLDAIDICCRGIIVATVSLSATTPRTFLVVLVLFAGLGLIGERLLGVLSTMFVNKKSVSRLILLRVFFLFLHRLVFLETLGIDLADI